MTMMRDRTRTIAFLLASSVGALLYSSCSVTPVVQGNGDIATEGRELASFRSIEVEGAVDVTITYGAKQSVELRTDENLLDIITTEVSFDGELKISSTEPYIASHRVTLEIVVPVLEGVEIEGSSIVKVGGTQLENNDVEKFTILIEGSGTFIIGSMVADYIGVRVEGSGWVYFSDMQTDSVDVEVEGSGDVDLDGETQALKVVIEGSSTMTATDLIAEHADITVEGSGDVRVHVTSFLRATIEGSGAIRYKGDPRVESKVSGSGVIERL